MSFKQDTDYKPVPLKAGEGEEYMLALKQELRETMKRMPYYLETPEEKQGGFGPFGYVVECVQTRQCLCTRQRVIWC